jgi:SAM-dependent methyltransferase
MNLVGSVHGHLVSPRRVRLLSSRIAKQLPQGASVLDVGCGDGAMARAILDARPDLTLTGVDVLIRPHTAIPVRAFDGHTLPVGNREVDAVLFVDVLHHTLHADQLLQEAARVARQAIVVKDHLEANWFDRQTLRLMDWVGNSTHGVALPYAYWPRARWEGAIAAIGARVESWEERLDLYPWPATLLFDRSLHFLARLGLNALESPP